MVDQMRNGYSKWRQLIMAGGLGVTAALAVVTAPPPALAQEPIRIGLVAALSGASAQSGEAITRGLAIAIDEINAKGGLLGGRKLELVSRDDESVPPKGVVAVRELISKEKVAALFGGIDTPVGLASVTVRIKMWKDGLLLNPPDGDLRPAAVQAPRLGD
jgi:branched-chain amino acid transport system substrate-binding protein